MQEWHDFFVAQVGATAALAGLLFVALSVNVTQVLRYPWLPPRAAQSLIVLIGATVESSILLFPLPSTRWAAALAGIVALAVYAVALRLSISSATAHPGESQGDTRQIRILSTTITQIATLPSVAGAALGSFGYAGYEYWIAAGVMLALLYGLYTSWVLLVEILR
jgi:hypothetical protein